MTTLKFASYGSSVATFQNSDLASLANGSYVFGSGAGLTSNVYDNTSNLYPEADIHVLLGSITPSGTPFLTLYLLWALDGTNFDDPQTAGAPQAGTPSYTKGVNSGASAKIIVFSRVLLRPGKCKFVIGNNTGVSLAATSNSATMYPVTYTMS